MPLHCPYCQAAQSRDSHFCVHCGNFSPPLAVTGRPAPPLGIREPPALPDHRSEPGPPPVISASDPPAPLLFHPASSPWPLFAALALMAIVALSADHLVTRGSRETPRILAGTSPLRTRPIPHAVPPPVSKPLTVDLRCLPLGKPVTVGSALVLTASAGPAPGRTLLLALFSRKKGGRLSRFSLAEGHLCSAVWTPPAPGRYQFRASASDGRARSVLSRVLWVTVNPLAPVLPPDRREAARRVPRHRYQRRLTASRPVMPRPVMVRPVSPLPVPVSTDPIPSAPVFAPLYHVVAASFPRSRNAIVLAKSFWSRDIKAAVRRLPDRQGKPVYAVEMGGFQSSEEAQEAALTLQRSGYPAYSVASR